MRRNLSFKKIFFIIIFLIISSFCISQDWTWMHGTNTWDQPGIYGTMGISAPANAPGSRYRSGTWTDTSGNLWLFGGVGLPASTLTTHMNDLWKYNPSINQWTWIRGTSSLWQYGNYGTKGVAAPSNEPGVRYGSVTWRDTLNNLWLFGGRGAGTSNTGDLNDLWKYDISTNQWTWISGSNLIDQNGVYGTLGVASNTNFPGCRETAMGWIDKNGFFWLFGGYGFPDSGTSGRLNDLWRYNPATNEWTWMKGTKIIDQLGLYGTMGVSSATNCPGGRVYSSTWIDTNNNLWLFGGSGYGISGGAGDLNDIWRYDLSINEWVWLKGTPSVTTSPVYGTQGISSSLNNPGGRYGDAIWKDATNNIWVFGGNLYNIGESSDLWKYNPSINEWTWIKGPNIGGQIGVYGIKGISTSTNNPGARYCQIFWKDKPGNFWLFGGFGESSNGKSYLNDLWKYIPCGLPLTSPTNTTNISNQSICSNKSTTLSVASAGGTINWYPSLTSTVALGTGTTYVTPTLSVGNYTYYAEAATSCNQSSRVAITVTVNLTPTLAINSNSTTCSGSSISLNANGANSYTWNSGSTTQSISVTLTTTTSFTVIGTSNGCNSSAVKTITVFPVPTLTTISTSSLICSGQTVTLSVTGANTYTWDNNVNGPAIVVSPTVTTTYTVTGTDGNGCLNNSTITQNVSPCAGMIEISNTSDEIKIYPNPNAGQFILEIYGNEKNKIEIIDITGKEIYSNITDKNKIEIDIKNLSSGIYYLKISNAKIKNTSKIIKQ